MNAKGFVGKSPLRKHGIFSRREYWHVTRRVTCTTMFYEPGDYEVHPGTVYAGCARVPVSLPASINVGFFLRPKHSIFLWKSDDGELRVLEHLPYGASLRGCFLRWTKVPSRPRHAEFLSWGADVIEALVATRDPSVQSTATLLILEVGSYAGFVAIDVFSRNSAAP